MDVSRASGIDLQDVSGDAKRKLAIVENLGQGAAALDYDGDGLMDLYIANGDFLPGPPHPQVETRPALYKNLGNFRFQDVTKEAGLIFKGWAHGAFSVDFDADGRPDLYTTVYGGRNRFYRNLGNGRFQDVTESWGGGDAGPSTAACFFDADGDGDLDLYVGNYVLYDPKHPPNNGQPCNWKGLLVSCGPRGTPAAADTFYENQGGRLVEAGQRFGFAAVKKAYTLGVISCDFDNDGDVDLYVANDSVKNYLFENQGKGRFVEKAFDYACDMASSSNAQAGMGLDAGDLDHDGRFDILVTNFSQDYNTYYHNESAPSGTTYFHDVTTLARLNAPAYDNLSWGCRMTDLDRDGYQDLIICSGHVYPQVDGSELGTTYAQYNQIYKNLGPDQQGNLRFADITKSAGPGFSKKSVSRGLCTVDLDNDGDLDLLIVEMDSRPTLLKNQSQSPGHWVGFLIIGSGMNRDGIGTRLKVTDSLGVARYRERSFGSSYISTCDPRILVGLGKAAAPLREVRVRWPDGHIKTFKNLAPDRYWILDQKSGAIRPASR